MGKDVLREILGRRDPQGMYVIPADPQAREVVEKFRGFGATYEIVGDTMFVRVRARSVAEKIARILLNRGLLKLE